MKLHRLGYTEEGEKIVSRSARKRVGRGIGSGTGKTAGKGHKGQNARSGGGVRIGFEGGQTPLFRRLPKRGFTNIHKKQFITIDLDQLEKFEANSEVTPEFLHENKVLTNAELAKVQKGKVGIKVLGSGSLTKKLSVKANKFTASAEEKINAVGGNVEVI